MEEVWKDIPGYEGAYQVSSLGRVRSLDRCQTCRSRCGNEYRRGLKGRILKPDKNNSGIPYYAVSLKVDSNRKRFLVHRLVAMTFFGPCPKGQEVRHLDNDYKNNCVSNLAYGTRSENRLDSIRADRHAHKLSRPQVLEIRKRIEAGEPNTHICVDYNVSNVVISNIRLGRSYREVR